MKPRGSYAVTAQRHSALDGLDLFCTAPWGTRALIAHVLPNLGITTSKLSKMVVLEPCAGLGHMSDVLRESFGKVITSDVHDYGGLDHVGSFVGEGQDVIDEQRVGTVDWVITNPPFKCAAEIARRAMPLARRGVALLLRTQWIETKERFDLFSRYPLVAFAPFCGRLAMVEGRWDPSASTATSYAWFVWVKRFPVNRLILIPPNARASLTRADDVEKFAMRGVSSTREV